MFGLSKLYLGIGAAVLVLLLGGWVHHSGYTSGLHKGRAQVQAAWDKEKTLQMAAAQAHNAQADKITTDIVPKAEAAQVVIQTRYRTLVEKVPQYVPTQTAPGVIRGDDRVPVGALVLLDAAARGDNPDAIPFAAGKSYDLASPVRFTELVGGYVENLGIGHQNSAQLDGLEEWVRLQGAANPGTAK